MRFQRKMNINKVTDGTTLNILQRFMNNKPTNIFAD